MSGDPSVRERDAVRCQLGKWAEHGVPKRGWSCAHVEDLGEPVAICAMCETMTIRYVHRMEHPDYPEALDCGCICAGHMSEDYAGAKLREAEVRDRATRRRKFPERKGWRLSRLGNAHIKADGCHIVILPRQSGFVIGITPTQTYAVPRPNTVWGRGPMQPNTMPEPARSTHSNG